MCDHQHHNNNNNNSLIKRRRCLITDHIRIIPPVFFSILLFLYANTASAWSVNAYEAYEIGLPDMKSAASAGCALDSGETRIAATIVTSVEPVTATVICENFSGGKWWYWRAPFIASEPGDLGYFMDAKGLDTEDLGKAKACSRNPINLINGNKYKIYTDIGHETSSGMARPGFTRYYNSQSTLANSTIGDNWSHSYDRRIIRDDALRQKINIELDSGGAQSDVYQSSVYAGRQDACETGIADIRAQAQGLAPGPFKNLQAYTTATAQWIDNECRIYVDGRFRAIFPMHTHGVFQSDDNSWDTYLNFYRPDGKIVKFRKIVTIGFYTYTVLWEEVLSSGYKLEEIDVSPPPVNGVASPYQANYILTTPEDVVETYDPSGRLLTVDYPNGISETLVYQDDQLVQVYNSLGQSIDFQYNIDGLIEYVMDDAGRTWEYRYLDSNLVEAVNPDATSVKYHYEDSNFPSGLTGVTDERNVRRSTFEYHADGLAKSSYLGPPGALPSLKIENVDVSYAALSNTVTNSRGFQSTYHFSGDVLKGLMTRYDGPECVGCTGGSSSYVYDIDLQSPRDSTLNLLSSTEYGLNVTYENYDENGNPGTVTEAVGTPEQRTTTFTYDVRFPARVATRTEPSVFAAGSKVTTYTYDDYGNTTSITITGYRPDGTPVSRTQSFSYDAPYHQLSEIDGPRTAVTDITNIDYYADTEAEGANRARMKKITAPPGVVLVDNITYTATGKQASYTTGNGLQVVFNYYPGNDRLQTQTLTELSSGESRTTRWTYTATGKVASITHGDATPDATTLTFEYDDANRLKRIYDGFGNYIEYTLDTEDNATSETIHDSAGVLQKSMNQTFDAYNRLDIATQLNETRNQDYAPDGTLDLETDGKNVVTDYSYDALRRMTSVTQDLGGTDPASANALTRFGYDVQDNLVSVTDPNGGQTQYVYDDLGNLLSLSSPDTGTAAYTHDEAGNVTSMTDARGQLFNYSYDALDRITSADAPGTADDITFAYDTCQNGTGRLCTVTNGAATVNYSYDAFGNITEHQGVSYSYDATNRIKTITYPSGQIVSYSYDAAGQVSDVGLTLDGQTIPLASNISYAPFGGITGLAYGNVLSYTQHWDAAYRLISQSIEDILSLDYPVYDENGNLSQRDDATVNPPVSSTFGYDALDRLTDASGPFGSGWSYDYDRNGNRTQTNESASASLAYETESNRLDAIGTVDVILDPAGNTIDNGDWHYTYTAHNRLASVSQAGVNLASYTYNGLGQRVTKTLAGAGSVNYVYAPDGALLTETDAAGVALKEFVYLNGKPLAMIDHDRDSDGVRNEDDNCIDMPNGPLQLDAGGHSQWDTDGDGYGNMCDADLNQSGFVDEGDLGIFKSRFRTTDPDADLNGDGYANAVDLAIFKTLYFKPVGPSGSNGEAGSTPVYTIHNDHLGTPQMLTDENGTAVWSAVYDPFGKAAVNEDMDSDGNRITMNIRFPGQYYDFESGLHYNYFRYYDSNTGRYITSDPIGLLCGINTYTYVVNNPINFVDPFGLARRQERPLDVPGLRNTTIGPLQHDRFQYDNGSDSGYYDDGTVRPDNAPQSLLNQYQDVGRWLEDNALRQAEQNVQNNGWFNDPYNLNPFNSHQCQDYADEVESEYDRITDRWVNTRRGTRERNGWRQQWWRL